MGVVKTQVVAALSPPLPHEIVSHLLDEYIEIKQHFALGKFRPNELNGGRFAESISRLIQYLDTGIYTNYGDSLPNTDTIFNRAAHLRDASGNNLHDSIRVYVPRLARMLLDIRNRRDVAHVGGDVNANYSDSVFVTHMADWTMTELIRVYYNCSIDVAKKIVDSLNETHVPVIEDVDGFVRILNTKLSTKEMVLAILYYKYPIKIKDVALLQWTRHTHSTRFKNQVLGSLDADALIHYDKEGYCTLLRTGILHVEKNLDLSITI